PLELRARNAKGHRSQPRSKLHALRGAGLRKPWQVKRLHRATQRRIWTRIDCAGRLGKPPHVEGTAHGRVDGRGMPGGSGEPGQVHSHQVEVPTQHAVHAAGAPAAYAVAYERRGRFAVAADDDAAVVV